MQATSKSLVWTPTGWQWLPVIAITIVVYEALRSTIVLSIKHRYERHVQDFMRQQGIPDDPFRHTHRVVVKERVLADPHLHHAIVRRAKDEDRAFHAVETEVREWLDEIVPQFSILAYYKVGYRIARLMAYATYNVRLHEESLKRAQEAIPEDASVVYVSNHRSNADFIVTGFMLMKSVQISYAVGEWARVWPLESMVKAFGSYFVRRGEKDPLYHQTLEAYLQLITKEGVTQAMFPEGGLTRDGSLRPVKLGLLDYMARCKLDPDFDRPIVFIPVGINFDRVVEDENMLREAKLIAQGLPPKPRRSILNRLVRLLLTVPKLLIHTSINTARFLAKRLKKHGVAAIHFGDPIVFDEWYEAHKPDLEEPDRKKRQDQLQPFGDQLMQAIGKVMPTTPATLVAAAMHEIGAERMKAGVDRGTMILAMRQVFERLKAVGAPIAIDDPYAERRAGHRRMVTAAVTADLDEAEMLDRALDLALDVTTKRHVLYQRGNLFHGDRPDLIEYYTRSIEQHLHAPKVVAA